MAKAYRAAFLLALAGLSLTCFTSCNGGGGGGGAAPPALSALPHEVYLQFDGQSDVVTVTPGAPWQPSGDAFTFAVWINLSSWGGGGRGTLAALGDALALVVSEQTQGLRLIFNGTPYDSDPSVLSLDTWHHVAVVYDNGNLTFYVDGLEAGTVQGLSGDIAGIPTLLFGRMLGDPAYAFDGGMDEIWLVERALSASEIDSLARRTADPAGAGVVLALFFDAGAGQEEKDQSPNGNDALLGFTPEREREDPTWVVGGNPVNLPPVVSAGPDQTITMPPDDTVTLAGSVLDDGLPSDQVTVSWSVVSGPADVSFGQASSPETTATFQQPGLYVLRLTADDGELEASDDVIVTVNPASDQPPQVTITSPAYGDVLSGEVAITAEATDDVAVTQVEFLLDGNSLVVDSEAPYETGWDTTSVDDGQHTITAIATDTGGNKATQTIAVVVQNGANQAPIVRILEVVPSDTVTLPQRTVTLRGEVTDDGQPSGSVTITWTMVQGPKPVSFSRPDHQETEATFSKAGTYTLRLSASDGQLEGWAEVVITVNPPSEPNQAPVVDAGPNQSIVFGDAVSLDATVTDDGLPGLPLTYQWTAVSGPGTVTFADPSAEDTTASFSEPGEYVLRLTVSDSDLEGSDELTVRVRALDHIVVEPAEVTLGAGETQQFTATGYDQYGDPLDFAPTWTATGGDITPEGLYTATAEGTFDVIAWGLGPGGLVNGTATVTVTTNRPKAIYLDFDGLDDYVQISDSDDLDLTGGAFTITAWINPAGWGENDQGRIVDHGGGSSGEEGGWTLQLYGDIEGLMVQIQNRSGSIGARSDPGVIQLNSWQHVAVTLSSGVIRFYVNGILSGEVSGAPAPSPRMSPVRIGMRATDMKRAFAGSIDEVTIWSKALSASEIQEIMTGFLSGSEEGLVAYYPLNDLDAQIAIDATSERHDGVLGSTTEPDQNDPVWASAAVPAVWIVSPKPLHLQSGHEVEVLAAVRNLQPGWGIRYVLDEGAPGEVSHDSYTGEYSHLFTGVPFGEHTIDLYIIDDSGQPVSGARTHDHVERIGVGVAYLAMGDSITEGTNHDDFEDDDTSQDGRNEGGGFEPILNDLLTAYNGIPHTVMRDAVGGRTSADGAFRARFIFSNPAYQDVKYVLVLFGTNDALDNVPSGLGLSPGDPGYEGSYKANMQLLIDRCFRKGKTPILAKIPVIDAPCAGCASYPDPLAPGTLNDYVKEYNQVVDELTAGNGLPASGPDLFSLFLGVDRSKYYDDFIHPNGEGYKLMAQAWFDVLKHLEPSP